MPWNHLITISTPNCYSTVYSRKNKSSIILGPHPPKNHFFQPLAGSSSVELKRPIFTEMFKLHSGTLCWTPSNRRPLAKPKTRPLSQAKRNLKPCHSPRSIRIRLAELPRWFDNQTIESVLTIAIQRYWWNNIYRKKHDLVSNLYITLCQLRLVQFSRQIMTINPQQGCVVLQRSVESHKNDKHALLSWIMKALPCSSNAGHCVCLTLTGVRRGSSPALASLWYDGLHYSIHFGLQAEHILKRCTGHGWSCSSILIPSRLILRFRTSQLFFRKHGIGTARPI